METKEAIKWVFDIWHEWENVYGYDAEQNLKEGKKLDEVIELLRRGEEYKKYKAMFNDIGKHQYIDIEMEKASIKADFFPEPKSRLIKLMHELDRAIKEILEEVVK